jgi:hypothetical protein
MKILVALACALVAYAPPVRCQAIAIELHGVSATSRQSGVVLSSEPGRGLGVGAGIHISLGRLHLAGTAIDASMSRDRGETGSAITDSWDFQQIDFRFRLDLFGPLSLEGFGVRQFLNPDFNGNELAYLGVGGYGDMVIVRGARLWGRLGLIVTAAFKGSGRTSVTPETQLGFEVDLSRRLSLVGSYGFQRVDRNLNSPPRKSELAFDVLRVGLRFGVVGGGR